MNELRVNISPGVSMLGVLSRLNYKPWFALAEYVDNSVQSMISRREGLVGLHGPSYQLVVSIDIDSVEPGSIIIRDNAAGIPLTDFPRAFRAAQIPPDREGLSEFGMGMKSASCWFANRWGVRTAAIGDTIGHSVSFNIADIVKDELDELEISEFQTNVDSHFTEVRLWELNHKPVGRTIGKIKQHLRDIYREFIRDGSLLLKVNGEELTYVEPTVLEAPFFRNPGAESLQWRKEISFDFGDGMTVEGFAAIRDKGDTQHSGFALFRRGRVIQGTGDEGYRPAAVFGAGNSFRSQRLYGELHLSGFDVSHTKDGFQWDSNEDPFLDLLREQLDAEPLPLLKQAEGHRATAPSPDHVKLATAAVSNTVGTLQTNLPNAITQVEDLEPVESPVEIPRGSDGVVREFEFLHESITWKFRIELSREEGDDRWMSHSTDSGTPGVQNVHLRLNTAHDFILRFGISSVDSLEAILRIAVAIVVAEMLARASGVRFAGTVARNIDRVLNAALSKP